MKILKFLLKIIGYEIYLIGKTIENKPIYAFNKKLSSIKNHYDYVDNNKIKRILKVQDDLEKQALLDSVTNPRKYDNSGVDLSLFLDKEKLDNISNLYHRISLDNTLPKYTKKKGVITPITKTVVSNDGKKIYSI